MTIIDLCVLAHRSPLVGAYLRHMRAAGFMPRKIIDLRLHVSGRRFRILRALLGRPWAGEVLYRFQLRTVVASLDESLVRILRQPTGSALEWLDVNYCDFAPEVERVYAPGLNDEAVANVLERQPCKTFLFTGGGLLRKRLLAIPGARFIHVHPAIVPDIKGADGLLWSILLRGRPGASCFYMSEGIDTGDVIYKRQFDMPRLQLGQAAFRHDQLYAALLAGYDPMLRATTLVEVLKKFGSIALDRLPANPQPVAAGRTYFFMHPKVRDCVINRIVRMAATTAPQLS